MWVCRPEGVGGSQITDLNEEEGRDTWHVN